MLEGCEKRAFLKRLYRYYRLFLARELFPPPNLDILDTPEAFIGKICTIKSPRADQKFGQAEIENPNGAPFLFNVKPTSEGEVLKRGESAVIVDKNDKVFNIKKINI